MGWEVKEGPGCAVGVQMCRVQSSWAGICMGLRPAGWVKAVALDSAALQQRCPGAAGRAESTRCSCADRHCALPERHPITHVCDEPCTCLPAGCCCCRDFPPPGPPPVRAPPKELTMFIAGLGPSTHERVSAAAQATHAPAILKGLPCLVRAQRLLLPHSLCLCRGAEATPVCEVLAGWFQHATVPGLLYPLQLYPTTLHAVRGLPTSLAHSPVP